MPTLDLTTSIGSPFDVRRFSVKETISGTFDIDIVAIADEHSIDLEAVVGQGASFRVDTGYVFSKVSKRQWSGTCSHIEQVQGMLPSRDGTRVKSTYRLRIAPNIWLMGQRTNHRIFQRLSIPDIVDQVLSFWNVEATWKIDRGEYPKLEYKSQYGETDFSFVARLLEEAGISYVLHDADGSTELVMSDALNTAPLKDHGSVTYEDNPTEAAQREFVTHVRLSHDVRQGARHLVDYDMRHPAQRMFGEGAKAAEPEGKYEQYDYRTGAFHIEGKGGGDTPTADDKGAYRHDASYGKKLAQYGLDGHRVGKRAVEFETNVVGLGPAIQFTIENHPHDSLAEKLMVVGFELNGTHDGKWDMHARAVFAKEAFRPALRTAKPKVYGTQTATVVGPSGQEIHVDEFGRVRVQFPWDRDGKSNDESSVWMRVNQGWGGVGFGMITIPRIGQEVLVGFLDGDVDDPVVMGRVYNALNPVPYKLPDRKTISGWKTNSSPTNGGYNEIQLEDRAQKELIYIRAQRDEHHLVQRNLVHRIEKDHHQTVLENQHLLVKKIKKEWILEDDHLHVVGDRMQKIDKSTSLEVGHDQHEKVGNLHALAAGKEIHLKAGSTVVMEAGSELTIKGAGGHIKIHPGGVDIVGVLVKINSGGSPGSGAAASPVAPKDAEEAFPKDNCDDIKE